MSSQSSQSSVSSSDHDEESAFDDYPSDLEQPSAQETDGPPKLTLKLNVPRTDPTTPGQTGRKRSRQVEDPAGETDDTPLTSNVGRKLKLNVRPHPATPTPAMETPILKKPTLKLKLSSSAPTTTPTESTSTPVPRKSHISKVKLKAPTLASPFPTPSSSTAASPATSSSTPTPKPQNDGDIYDETPSKKSRVIKSFPSRSRATHPLAEEVVPTPATPEEDVSMTNHNIVKDDLQDVRTVHLVDGGETRSSSEVPQPPSAIPRYLQSETRAFPPEPSSVKLESDDSPSPNPIDSSAPSPHDSTPSGTSTPQTEWTGAYAQRGGRGRPYLRVKRPFREVLKRILTDLKRKDQYGLFLDPVSEEDYPGYWEAIGGQDKAMDLGTMERKVDDKEYKNLEEFEADISRMVEACRTFNGPDTFPTREGEVVQALAEKLIERHRHVVRSPSPSPVRGSTVAPTPGITPDLRSVSPSLLQQARPPIPPKSLIPEAMLEYPSNSDPARAVGYFATGGKRQRTKKEIRSREKWDGQWREWYVEGDRNLGEADDATELLGVGFRTEKIEKPSVINWDDPVMRAEEVWQPTPVLLGQTEEEPPAIPTRTAGHLDWGINQELRLTDPRKEIAGARRDPAWQAVRTVTMGADLANEAYLRSIDAFIRGAETTVQAVETNKVDKRDVTIDAPPSLSEYVRTTWRGGFINDDLRGLVAEAGRAIAGTSDDNDIQGMVNAARKRLPILNELRSSSARGPGVDLACLLHSSSDFSVGTGPGPGAGAARAAWFQSSLFKAGQQIVDASKRREAKVEVGADEDEKMKKLRLDLLALVKNVPVHELRPMTSAEAEKLPPAVRGLVKVLPAGKSS